MYAPRLLPLVLLLAACQNAKESVPAEPQPETPTETAARMLAEGETEGAQALLAEVVADERLDEAAAQFAAGDPRGAHASLTSALELIAPNARSESLRTKIETALFAKSLAEGREMLATGDPRDAMLRLDEAVSISPADPELLFLRGIGTLRIGLEDGNTFLFEDALRNFNKAARSGQRPAAWYGAARAEFQLYSDGDAKRIARALASVRRGDAARAKRASDADLAASDVADEALLPNLPERTSSTVLMWSSSLAADGQFVDEDAANLRAEWRGHATALVGLTPEDPWAWNQVALSLLWDGSFAKAADAARQGVLHAPEDTALHATLSDAANQLGGAAAVYEAYRGLTAELPESPTCQWNYGLAAFEYGLASWETERSDQSEPFALAEGAFNAARSLDPSLHDSCIGYEVVARSGQGWSHHHAGRLDESRDAFLSMEDLFEGGMRWKVEDRIQSGLRGLEYVVFGYSTRWNDETRTMEERFRGLEKAANLSSTMHEYDPTDGQFANNAGFFHRDAGVALNNEAIPIAAKLSGEDAPTGMEREELLQRARAMTRRAMEHAQTSYRAYLEAARLLPEDARVVNDCGVVQVYYLRDPEGTDDAEKAFMDAIDAGRAQLAVEGISDEGIYAVKNAIGDAYQNLGYLYLSILKKPIVAKNWLEKSLEIGPDARPQITAQLLPDCERLLNDQLSDDEIQAIYGWPVALPE